MEEVGRQPTSPAITALQLDGGTRAQTRSTFSSVEGFGLEVMTTSSRDADGHSRARTSSDSRRKFRPGQSLSSRPAPQGLPNGLRIDLLRWQSAVAKELHPPVRFV